MVRAEPTGSTPNPGPAGRRPGAPAAEERSPHARGAPLTPGDPLASVGAASPTDAAPLHPIQAAAWGAAIATLPIYFFSSGQPQPTDWVLAVLAPVALLGSARSRAPGTLRSAGVLALFVAVVVAVNAVWLELTGSHDFVTTTLFYVFNLLVFTGAGVMAEAHGPAFARVVAWAAGVSLVAHVAAAFAFPALELSGRLHLFTNNPNQLAYASLGLASLVFVAARVAAVPQWLPLVAATAAGFLIFRTYSRAALLALGTLALVALVRRPALVLVLALPLLVGGLAIGDDLAEDELLRERFSAVAEGGLEDYVEDRGIQRVLDHPEYLIAGAGEGAHGRFHPLGLELHSSFASVAFSYGVLGVIALGAFVVVLVRGGEGRTALLLAPVALYGAFHNGMRFRVLWILLACAGAAIVGEARARGQPARAGP
ncbi:MAG: hypothetical protein IT376_21915 [Polyangiaceae bacterium]|nr:hypothetical protein [Polyangiaceae bacterium]